MIFVYEIVLTPEEDDDNIYNVTVPDLDGTFTFGEGIADAVRMGIDATECMLYGLIQYGDPIPAPTFGHEAPKGGLVVAIAASVDEEEARTEPIRISTRSAAFALGVKTPMVRYLIHKGVLDGEKEGRDWWITKDSVEAAKNRRRKPGPVPKSQTSVHGESPVVG